jgi:thiol-disulfide isomerase/thioredoxin
MILIALLAFLPLIVIRLTDGAVMFDSPMLSELNLTSSQLNSTIYDRNFTFVEFYGSWCERSKQLLSTLQEVNQSTSAFLSELSVVAVEFDNNVDIMNKYGLKGSPTFMLFSKYDVDSPLIYTGDSTVDAMSSWIIKKINFSIPSLQNFEDVNKFVTSNKVSVILNNGYVSLADKEKADDYLVPSTTSHLRFISQKNHDVSFAVSNLTDILLKNDEKIFGTEITQNTFIMLHEHFNDGLHLYEGSLETEKIDNFIRSNREPFLHPYMEEYVRYIFEQNKNVIMLVKSSNEQGFEAQKMLYSVGKSMKDKFNFCIIDMGQPEALYFVDYLGINVFQIPLFIFVDVDSEFRKYIMPKEKNLSIDSIKDFIVKSDAGAMKPTYKSDSIPEHNTTVDGILNLVGLSFKTAVIEADTFTFIKFYIPDCQYCEEVSSVFADLALHYKNISNITFAQIDSSTNTIHVNNPIAYPTLRLYSPRGVIFDDFTGDRAFDSINTTQHAEKKEANASRIETKSSEESTIIEEL